MKPLKLITVLAFFMLVLVKNAYSYLDPGTGSYLIQILAAALFGSLFVIKIFWTKIKLFFKGTKKDEDSK